MGIGFWQVVLILLIVLILFGAGKLPRVMGDLAKGIKSFKAGMNEDSSKSEDTGEAPQSIDAQPESGQATAAQSESQDAARSGKS